MTVTTDVSTAKVTSVADFLQEKGWRLATAESCTGGWVAKACTDLAGSSAWFECGLVTYSNAAKQKLLGVLPETLETHGAVSEAVTAEMAQGALRVSAGDVAVSVSGIAGPSGATATKPVGMVCFRWATAEQTVTDTQCFSGDRDAVRRQSVEHALQRILTLR